MYIYIYICVYIQWPLKPKYIICKPYCCTVHFVESLQLLTNNCTYINSTKST